MAAPGMTHAVVFDIGGVLMDWNPRHLFSRLIPDEHEREWFLTEVCGPEWNRQQDRGRNWAAAVEEAIARHPERASWIRAFDGRWIETVKGLYPETVRILRDVRRSPVAVYALTNFSAEKWAVASGRYDVLRLFDGVVVSGEERLAKPDPAIYRRLLDRYDLDPASTFFTDDVQDNVDAARAAGIDAELYVDAARLRAQLVERGVLRP